MKYLRFFLPILLILSLALGACSAPPSPTPTATPEPSSTPEPSATLDPTVTPTPTDTPGPTDDVWQRIVKNHKLVVGVSLDNPPFSSLSPLYQIEGLDVSLANEIGKHLNMPVEIQALAPQSLAAALQLNQIDLALAGIPNSENQDYQLWFSSPYLSDQSVALARKLAPIPNLTDFKQLALYRVGVESGSIFDRLIQTGLVDTGVMPKSHLFHYTYTGQAVQALDASQLDVVLTGRAAAGYFGLAYPDLHAIALGFAGQELAPAMLANLDGLKARVDLALQEMQTDGTLDGLTRKYVLGTSFSGLPPATPISPLALTAVPTDTPIPAANATPAAAPCLDGLQFLLDQTNGAVDWANPPKVKATKLFTQTWKVLNTGTCPWTPQYHLVLVYKNAAGADMAGVPALITSAVQPGKTAELTVTFTAPTNAGVYESFWQLQNDRGQVFGQALWAGIKANKTKNQAGSGGPPTTPKQTGCKVTLTGPGHDVKIRDTFDAIWEVTNTSGFTWKAATVVYVYFSGDKLQEQNSYSIPADIPSDSSDAATTTFTVDMNAPATPGLYSYTWNVMWDKKVLCTMVGSVNVVPK